MAAQGDGRRSLFLRRAAAVVALLASAALVIAALSALFGGGGEGSRAPSAGVTAKPEAGAAGAPTAATGSYRGPVPILMYHVVKAPSPGVAYPELWTPPRVFRETIDLLAADGWRGVTLSQVRRAWNGGPGLPSKPIVVSFDDGYLSHFQVARPILREAGWPGVLNLEGKNIGKGGLTVEQVKALIASGWEIGAHSLTHPDLTTVTPDQLRREVAGSRDLLRRTFGVPVESFCYPAGRNDAAVRLAVREAGFSNATTVEPGLASPDDDRFALPRIRVNGTDAPASVLERIRTGSGPGGAYG